ncbi:MAG: hypothetical protein FH756_17870 [Firmicutes bacterium]|nr:hypothetical protein [Bacillota bacterium]
MTLEEEINLRELIEVLLQGKWIIAGISLVAVMFAGVFSFFVLPEKYEAKATIIFDNKFVEQQGLSLASYEGLVADHARIKYVYDHLQLGEKEYTVSGLEESIKTEVDDEAGQIKITATGMDPELVQGVVNTLGQDSISDFRKRLIDDKDREIVKTESMLESVETELETVPKLLGTLEIKDQGARQVVQIPEVNPMYERLSGRWDGLSNSLSQLQAEKEYLEEGLQSGGKGLYIMLQQAPLPEKPVAPRKMLNVAVAGVLGVMVSVFVVFFREFWRSSGLEKDKE